MIFSKGVFFFIDQGQKSLYENKTNQLLVLPIGNYILLVIVKKLIRKHLKYKKTLQPRSQPIYKQDWTDTGYR